MKNLKGSLFDEDTGIIYSNYLLFEIWQKNHKNGFFYKIPLYRGTNIEYTPIGGGTYKIRNTDKIYLHRANCPHRVRGNPKKEGKAPLPSFKKAKRWLEKNGYNRIIICSDCHGGTTRRLNNEIVEDLLDSGFEVYKNDGDDYKLIKKGKHVKWWRIKE